MSAASAGLLTFRRRDSGVQVLLAHPGGPFWAKKDAGAWSLPKGEVEQGEEPLAAALREFEEETGLRPDGPYLDLGEIRQKAGKRVRAWAFEGDGDAAAMRSNDTTVEWPRGSGRRLTFPEVDRFEWFDLGEARRRLNPAQAPLLDRLSEALNAI